MFEPLLLLLLELDDPMTASLSRFASNRGDLDLCGTSSRPSFPLLVTPVFPQKCFFLSFSPATFPILPSPRTPGDGLVGVLPGAAVLSVCASLSSSSSLCIVSRGGLREMEGGGSRPYCSMRLYAVLRCSRRMSQGVGTGPVLSERESARRAAI